MHLASEGTQQSEGPLTNSLQLLLNSSLNQEATGAKLQASLWVYTSAVFISSELGFDNAIPFKMY